MAASNSPADWSTAGPNRSALNIRVAAQGVDAAAGHPHIAEQQLDHRHGADVLRADGVLRPARAYRKVVVRSAALVEASTSHTLRKSAFGVPQMFSTTSGV